MSQKAMKLTNIIEQPNPHQQTNRKYDPLRKNIQLGHSNNAVITEKDISGISYVAKRLKSLSPDQNQFIVIICHDQSGKPRLSR